MSKMIKVTCTVRKGYLLSLPGNIKVWGGAVTKIPEELLNNPGIKAYIKSGRLKIVDEADAEILPLQSPPEAPAIKPAPVSVPEEVVAEPATIGDLVTETVTEVAPVEAAPEPEVIVEATSRKGKKKAAEEAVAPDQPAAE